MKHSLAPATGGQIATPSTDAESLSLFCGCACIQFREIVEQKSRDLLTAVHAAPPSGFQVGRDRRLGQGYAQRAQCHDPED